MPQAAAVVDSPRLAAENLGNSITAGVSQALSVVALPVDRVMDGVVDVANRIGNGILRSPLGSVYDALQQWAPRLVEREAISPFGRVTLPEISLPHFCIRYLDKGEKDALKAAAVTDVGTVIGLVPWIGDIIGDVVEDIYMDAIRENLLADELVAYMKHDKLGPSAPAMLRALMIRCKNER